MLRVRSKQRVYALLIGILLVGIGQILVSWIDETAFPSTALSRWVSNGLHLGLPEIDSVLLGIFIILIGGFLLALNLKNLRLFSEEGSLEEKSPALAMIRPVWLVGLFIGLVIFAILLVQLNRMEYHPYSPWLWLSGLAMVLSVAIAWDRRRMVDLSPSLVRQDLIWLVGLWIGGLLIATFRLQGWPDQLMHDEGIFGSTARDIANGTFLPPIFAQGVDSFPILCSYWQAWVMKLFGVNIWGWRFASVLPGTMSVIPFYLLVRDLFGRRTAAISSAILLTNPFFLVYARLGYTNIQPMFLVTLAIYLLLLGLRRGSALYLLLAGFTAGLGFLTYFSGRSAFVISILFIVLIWLTRRIKFPAMFYAMIVFILGTLLVALPHIVYGFHQNPVSMSYRIFLSFFISVEHAGAFFPLDDLFAFAPSSWLGETEVFYNPKIYLVLILRGFAQTLLAYQRTGILWGQHYLACPLAGTYGAFFYLVGLVVALRKVKQARFQLALLWFFSIITFLSALNTFPPREDHMVPIVPALALLSGFGLETVAILVFSWLKRGQTFLVAILLAVLVAGGVQDYFVRGYQNYPPKPEDIMSWAGLRSRGESIYYVYETPIRPDFVPWVMFELRKEIHFEAIQINDFLEDHSLAEPGQPKIIFYPPEIGSRMTPFLQAQWGETLGTRVFYNLDGTPALMAGMNVPFTFERERTFGEILQDTFHQARFLALLVALLLCFGLLVFCPSLRTRSLSPSNTH